MRVVIHWAGSYMSISPSALATSAAAAALVSAIISIAGWFVAARREDKARRLEVDLRYLQRQLDELYGPLLGLLREQTAVYDVVKLMVPVKDGHPDLARFSSDSGRTWRHFADRHLIPIQRKMMDLIWTKIHLLDGNTLPNSLEQFVRNATQFEALHLLSQDEGITSSQIGAERWPEDLRSDLERTLMKIKGEYARKHGLATRPSAHFAWLRRR